MDKGWGFESSTVAALEYTDSIASNLTHHPRQDRGKQIDNRLFLPEVILSAQPDRLRVQLRKPASYRWPVRPLLSASMD
jgi:hypothetical protein